MLQIRYYPFAKKAKIIMSRKNTLEKETFPVSPKKMIFVLENMVFLSKFHIDSYSRLTF